MEKCNRDMSNAVAIIGMAGRFPGASSIEEFWRNMKKKHASFETLSEAELIQNGVHRSLLQHRDYIKAGSFIQEDIRCFDPSFFNISEQRASFMDPQQRLFLECAWEAMERAGYRTQASDLRIGVFGGSAWNSYLFNSISPNHELGQTIDDYDIELGNNKDHIAMLVAYTLNLTGPAITVQSCCSTSLLAVHVAAQSMLNGECDMALAGGVALRIPQRTGYLYKAGGILSKSGRCRPFDAHADGTVFGSGAGIVLLKPFEDAIEDNDTIHAVILGSAVNNDGSRKAGYVAPSLTGQSIVIREALENAGVHPMEVGYIETHGTGTHLGDPVEFNALRQVYGETVSKHPYCALGTVKANIGHLDVASGVAGLINVAHVLSEKTVPGLAGFEEVNPSIDIEHGPFYFPKETHPLQTSRDYAAISSFGVGGTNVHMILCAPPPRKMCKDWVSVPLIPLSAKTGEALAKMKLNLKEYLLRNPDLPLSDIAYTLQIGRNTFSRRECIYAESTTELIEQLDSDVHSGHQGNHATAATIICALSELSKETRTQIGRRFPFVRNSFDRLIREYAEGGELQCVTADDGSYEMFVGVVFNTILLKFLEMLGVPVELVILEGANEGLLAFDVTDPRQAIEFYSELQQGLTSLTSPVQRNRPATVFACPVYLASRNLLIDPPTSTVAGSNISLDELFARTVQDGCCALVMDFQDSGNLTLRDRLAPGSLRHDGLFSDTFGAGLTKQLGQFLTHVYRYGAFLSFDVLNQAVHGSRIPLPTYPFQKEVCWIYLSDSSEASPFHPAEEKHARMASAGEVRERAVRLLVELAPISLSEADFDRDFLQLGFDSLMLSQLVSKLASEFGLALSLTDFIESEWTPVKLLERVVHDISELTEGSRADLSITCLPASPEDTSDNRPRVSASSGLAPYLHSHANKRTVLSGGQEVYIRELTEKVCRKTALSKAMAASSHSVFCDPRSASGFDWKLKEMICPIVAAESSGARFLDIDGNEYIDMVMGFGVNYLGHAPSFITSALRNQLAKGYEIGPQTPLAAEVAKLITELTHNERVAFCNTGSEAVAAAMRVARTATRKEKVVMFNKSYHGGFDSVMGRRSFGLPAGQAVAIAPGIPSSALHDTCLLDYGDEESLAYIQAHGHEIAGVLVEPVQTRNPKNIPIQFLHRLRKLCDQKDIVLIFDEVVTGFRCHLGGAQELFGIQADLALYGKIIGGGLPIGAIAGKSRYMDYLDGGNWRFGDVTVPERERTFFDGTYVRHPLAMAAAEAALEFLKKQGPKLQIELTHRVLCFCDAMNQMFERYEVPIKIHSFSSFISHEMDPALTHINLLFHLLRYKGVYVLGELPGHFSIKHSEDDFEQIARAYEESIRELILNGLVPGRTA